VPLQHWPQYLSRNERAVLPLLQRRHLAAANAPTSVLAPQIETCAPLYPCSYPLHLLRTHPLFAIRHSLFFIRYFNASDPPTMSANSSVICDCRARLYCVDKYLIMSPAASVAAFIATIRAICSLKIASLKY
jgi:hypothetical protein